MGYHGDTGAPRGTSPTAAEIAKILGLDGGYLSRILQRFAQRKLISRTTSKADARHAHLALTARGHAALAPLQQLARDEVAMMLRHLSGNDRARVIDAMHLIRRSLGGNEDRASTETATVAKQPGADEGAFTL